MLPHSSRPKASFGWTSILKLDYWSDLPAPHRSPSTSSPGLTEGHLHHDAKMMKRLNDDDLPENKTTHDKPKKISSKVY